MLEKSRIQRAMFELDHGDGFTVRDLVAATSANEATVRKTVERTCAEGWLAQSHQRPNSTGRGGAEKLYRLTPEGRDAVLAHTHDVFVRLLAKPRSIRFPGRPEGDTAEAGADVIAQDALDAAIGDLERLCQRPPAARAAVADELRIALAELDEAAYDGGEVGRRATTLAQAVRRAADAAERLTADYDERGIRALTAALRDDMTEALEASLLDHLPALIPTLRRAALTHAPGRAKADALAGRVLSALMAGHQDLTDPAALARRAMTVLHDEVQQDADGSRMAALLRQMKQDVPALREPPPTRLPDEIKQTPPPALYAMAVPPRVINTDQAARPGLPAGAPAPAPVLRVAGYTILDALRTI